MVYTFSARLGRLFQGLVVKNGKIGVLKGPAKLATPLTAWTSGRDLRPIERQSFRELWSKELANKKN